MSADMETALKADMETALKADMETALKAQVRDNVCRHGDGLEGAGQG